LEVLTETYNKDEARKVSLSRANNSHIRIDPKELLELHITYSDFGTTEDKFLSHLKAAITTFMESFIHPILK